MKYTLKSGLTIGMLVAALAMTGGCGGRDDLCICPAALEVAAAPLVKHIEAPRPRPTRPPRQEIMPHSFDSFTIQHRLQRRRQIRQPGGDLRAQRAPQPTLPRKRECAFGLPDHLLR